MNRWWAAENRIGAWCIRHARLLVIVYMTDAMLQAGIGVILHHWYNIAFAAGLTVSACWIGMLARTVERERRVRAALLKMVMNGLYGKPDDVYGKYGNLYGTTEEETP